MTRELIDKDENVWIFWRYNTKNEWILVYFRYTDGTVVRYTYLIQEGNKSYRRKSND